MLLNLSNHPSGTWPSRQMLAAQTEFGGVEDMAFPSIDPSAEAAEIRLLADEYCKAICEREDAADLTVHLMGEMTFCHQLILLLQKNGIPVVASTTRRNVLAEADGRKTVQFEFVKFRHY